MKPLLIHIRPIDPATGARVDIRVGSAPSPRFMGLGGLRWEGGVSRRPRLMLDLMSPDLNGKVQTGRGDFMLNLNEITAHAMPSSLQWSGAPVIIYDATDANETALPIEFKGIVANDQLDIWTRQLILNLSVEITKLDRPLLTVEFDGSGGINGDADKRGALAPAGFGYVENVEPFWFDETNNVGMLDGYGNVTTFHGLFEGGADLGASVGDYANYGALVAASIPKGRWGTCRAYGLVRLGAPPAGRISADVTFRGAGGAGANRTGALITRILEIHCGLDPAEIDVASFVALDAAVARNVHYWTKDQRQVQDLCEALAAGANASLLILLNGLVSVTRAFGGANIGTLNRTGTSVPPITDWAVSATEEPVWRMRVRSCRPGAVFSYDEIFYEDDLEDKGAYSNTETYRQGHMVWMPDGSQWVYTNATPGSGHAPPAAPATSNAYWTRTRPPTTAADLVYADGTPIESLKPGEAGANVTESRTAAAFAGQGALATQNQAAFGTQISGLPAAIQPGNILTGGRLDVNYAQYGPGGPLVINLQPQEAGANITESRTAAAFYGQGALATKSIVSGTDMVNITGGLTLNADPGIKDPAIWLTTGGQTRVDDATFIGGKAWEVTTPVNLFTERFAIDPTRSYTASFRAKNGAGSTRTCYGTCVFYDATGAEIFGYMEPAGWVVGTYHYFGLLGTSPPGTTTEYTINFGSGYSQGVPPSARFMRLGWLAAYANEGAGSQRVGSPMVTELMTFGRLSDTAVRLASNVRRADGTTLVTDAMAITSLGTAAAFAGQGALATLNSLAYGGGYLTGFGALAPLSNLRLGNPSGDPTTGRIVDDTNSFYLTNGYVVTSVGTAAAIAGQGTFATLSAIDATLANANNLLRYTSGGLFTGDLGADRQLALSSWGTSGVTIRGNSFFRTAGDLDYSATVFGQQEISGPQFVACNALNGGWTALGLDDDLNNFGYNQTSAHVEYLNSSSGGIAALYVGGVWQWTVSGIGDFAGRPVVLLYDDFFFRVFIAGIAIGTPAQTTSGRRLFPVWYAYHAAAAITGLRAGPVHAVARIGFNTFDNGGTLKNNADLVTILGTAAAFTGQAAIATDSDAIPRILSMRGDNYIRNGTFVEGAGQWGTRGIHVDVVTYSAANYPAEGGLRFNSGAIIDNSYVYTNGGVMVPFPSKRAYVSFQAYLETIASTVVYCGVNCFDGAGNYLGTAAQNLTLTNGGWYYYDTAAMDLFAGTAKVNLYLHRTTNFGGHLHLTNVRMAPTARMASPGAIAGFDTFRADGVTVMSQAEIRTAEGTAAAFAGQGSLATLNNLTAAYVNFRVGTGNLMSNGSFEVSSNGTTADGVLFYTNSPGEGEVLSIVAGRSGGYAQRIAWTSNTTQKGLYLAYANGGIWQANKSYVWTFWLKGSGAAIGTTMAWAWNTAPSAITWVENPAISAVWQRYVMRMTWGGAVDANGFLTVAGGTANGVASIDIDDMMIAEGDVAADFVPQTRLLNMDGRAVDGRTLNSSNLFGIRSLVSSVPTLSDTDNGGTVTINIGSSTFLSDWGQSITFPAGSVAGCAYGQTYHIWRNQGVPNSTGTSYGASTTFSDVFGTGKVWLGDFITRSSGGVPPPPPPPPPWDNCVAAYALVLTRRGWIEAREVRAGDMLLVLTDDMAGTRWEACTGNLVAPSAAVRLRAGGIELDVSVTTPITHRGEENVRAPDCAGLFLPIWHDALAWALAEVEPIGEIEVAHIRCSQHTYLAGNVAGAGILTHNPNDPKP